jgi:hypothetical protein
MLRDEVWATIATPDAVRRDPVEPDLFSWANVPCFQRVVGTALMWISRPQQIAAGEFDARGLFESREAAEQHLAMLKEFFR